MTELAVIIVSYNVCELLARALHSLQEAVADAGLQARVIVVENGSQDGSAEMVQGRFPTVELLQPGENLGFAGGNNHALRYLGFGEGRRGEAEIVWLLNPDTEVMPGSVGRLVAHLRANPAVGAVGPCLQYGDGAFQHGAFAFPGLAQVALDLFPVPPRLLESRLNGRYPPSLWRGEEPFPVEMLLGAALMVRGIAIDQVGLLDDSYFMYVEELDWCRRIYEAGWALHALPSATVIHHGGQSTRQFRDRMFVALWRSRLRYYRKWESALYVEMVRVLLRLGMLWQSFRARGIEMQEERERRLGAYREVARL